MVRDSQLPEQGPAGYSEEYGRKVITICEVKVQGGTSFMLCGANVKALKNWPMRKKEAR